MDQVQSRAVAIVTAPSPPVAPNGDGAPLTFSWQRSPLGATGGDVSVLLHALKRRAPAAMNAGISGRIRLRIRPIRASPNARAVLIPGGSARGRAPFRVGTASTAGRVRQSRKR